MGFVCPLDIRLLSLACCGSEAAGVVRSWRSRAQAAPAGGPSTSATIPVLVIAGTITQPMAASVRRALTELPPAGRVIVFGACAASGGPYWDSPVVVEGLRAMVGNDDRLRGLVDEALVVPGCPPTGEALANALAVVTAVAALAAAVAVEQEVGSPTAGGAG